MGLDGLLRPRGLFGSCLINLMADDNTLKSTGPTSLSTWLV